MQNVAAGGATVRSDDGKEIFNAIVSDLVSLIAQVQASSKLIERAIDDEPGRGGQDSSDVIVLDDVTPCYVKAHAQLDACKTSLNTALHFVMAAKSTEFAVGQVQAARANALE